MKSDRKPPLAKSPMRLRTRRALRSVNASTPLRTPSGLMTKTQMKESPIKPEFNTVSCELRALAKMVDDELTAMSAKPTTGYANHPLSSNGGGGSLFQRGRFYDEYTARRNERLRKKQGKTGDGNEEEPKTGYSLGVKVESAKKKDSKKLESLKKSVVAAAATYASGGGADRSQHPRYALRSSVKKPPLPVVAVPMDVDGKSVRRTTASRTRRK